jgi:transcriptional regulator with XRE-family HTH domain
MTILFGIIPFYLSTLKNNFIHMETFDEKIGEKIKIYRKDNSLSMEKFAEMVNVPKDRLYKWEKGVTPYHTAEVDNVLNFINGIIPKDTTLPFTPVGIPVYDVEFSLGFTDIIKNNPNVSGYITLAEFKGCDAIVRAKGESMAKYINNNDWIGIKRIYDFDVLNYGNPYGIVTKEMNMIKYLKKGKKEDTYLLKCENENYDDFEIAKNKILELYLIKTIMPILTVI